MKTRNFLIVGALISITFLIAACYKSKSSYNSASNYKVSITNSAFSPASLTVGTGSTVTWTNNDNTVHAITAADGSINSGDIAAGSSYTKMFTTAGTYNYYDSRNASMTGVLIVTSTSSGGY
jgi:plastocyanin